MDYMDSRRGNIDIDLESGGMIGEDKESEAQDLTADDVSVNSRRLMHRTWSGLLGEQLKNVDVLSQEGLRSCVEALIADDVSVKNPEITEIHLGKLKDNRGNPKVKKAGKEKLKKPKPSKPPRPPKGPLLDAADIKLVKEISEMTIRKHKRMERLSALKKMKKESRSSARTNIVAMGITILFFLIIIFHGLLSFRR